MAYAILNSWTAMSTSLSLALPSGGPVAVVWGILPSFVGNLCMAASMAEICAVYPTSGGQYHWTYLLAPPSIARSLSWVAGWFSTCGWIALAATASSLAGQLITGAYALAHPDYEPERWHIFVVYTGYALIALALNLFCLRLLPGLNQLAIFWSLTGLTVIVITILSCSSGNFASGKFVFTQFTNETGWPDGCAWILGLLQACFGLTGYDAVSHMVDEMPRPSVYAPRVMMASVGIGAATGFVFLVSLLFCIKDVDVVNTSKAGALIEALHQGTGSVVGGVCLSVFSIVCMAFTAQALLTASSRMTMAFARDRGMPFSRLFAKATRGVPVPAILLNAALVILFGCIYLGSDSALNAILSSSVISLNVSYSIPVALILIRGRKLLRPKSFAGEPSFSLGPVWGPICNVVGLAFTLVTTVFFLFPPELPATGSSMNYAVAVFGFVGIVSVITWVVDGRKNFTGPRDLGGLLELAHAEIGEDSSDQSSVQEVAETKA